MFVKNENKMINLDYVEAIWVEKENEVIDFMEGKSVYKISYKLKARGVSGADYNLAKYDTYEEAISHLEVIQQYTQAIQLKS